MTKSNSSLSRRGRSELGRERHIKCLDLNNQSHSNRLFGSGRGSSASRGATVQRVHTVSTLLVLESRLSEVAGKGQTDAPMPGKRMDGDEKCGGICPESFCKVHLTAAFTRRAARAAREHDSLREVEREREKDLAPQSRRSSFILVTCACVTFPISRSI